MRVNDIYLAFLSAFESQDGNIDSFFSDYQSVSESLQSNLEKSLAEMTTLTNSALPTYETISSAQYYAEYGAHQVQLKINGSGIDKLFGGDFTTGLVSVSSITVDYPSEAVHLEVSGSGILTNLDTGAISGSFNSFHFTTPWFDVAASGSISVAGASVTSPIDIVGSVQELSITYPENSVLLSLFGKIDYYQDAFGKIDYSGDLTKVYLSKDGADLTINGDLSCTFDEQNGLNLSGSNWSTGIISVSSIAVNYPSQSIHLAFSGSGSGLSADLDTGAISGSFNSFHFTTPLLDVTASGSISVVGSSVISSIDVVGVLDELSVTYPKENILLSILGDIDYTQDASGQFHYNGSATEIHFNKAGADVAIKGEVLCAFDEQNGLSLSGSVHEIDVQIGDTIIECIGDINFGKNGIESGDINNLSISVNGNYYDASTLNLKDLIADFGGDGVVYLDQNGDWCINDATFPQFSDTIDYLLEIINPSPTVTAFSPADAATGIPVSRDIVVHFSEVVQAGTGAIEIHSGSANGALIAHYDVVTSSNLSIVGNTLTINPTENLVTGTHYFVTIADGSVKDLEGNSFAGTTTYDFTTAPAFSVHHINGMVTFWKTAAPIGDVTSTLTSSSASEIPSASVTDALAGLYQHLDMPDGTYALTNAKISGAAESSAIKANDALAALKIAVGMNPNADGSPVSSYQFLAADVNHDGQVKAADALNILKMAVKLSTAPEKEWLFVPESVGSETMSRTHVVWPDSTIPVTLDVDQELHLIGIVKGDVNGSWVG
jgi:Bacterial Ig-like domain